MQNEIYHEYLEECKQEQVPVVLTAAEVMDILGVGKNTVYRLLNSGRLRGVRVGRSWRISMDSLNEFIP
ncbi:MAG: helix-turn-helix domain-containing protein [Lawsonibacter sp.]|nr:helix-turn-helix domain-containing protein [Lawsonibacter sp.]